MRRKASPASRTRLQRDDTGASTPGGSAARPAQRAAGSSTGTPGESAVNEKLANKLSDTVKELAAAKEELQQRKASHLRREKKLQDEISHLNHSLQEAVGSRTGQEQMEVIRSTHGAIQEQLMHMQGRTMEMLRQQKDQMTNSFRAKLAEVVDAKAKSNEQEHSAEEWATRFSKAQDHLKRTETQLIDSDRRNKLLEAENKRMRSQYRSQENDREFLVRQLVSVKRDNARLREELEGANDRKPTKPTTESGSLSLQRPNTAGSLRPSSASHGASDERLRDTVTRLRKTLERERSQLRQVRAAYATDQQNRTQLEVLLMQCVEDVRKEIGRQRTETSRPISRHGRPPSASSGRMGELDEVSRGQLMEVLLSKEEVVRLLYEKTFHRVIAPGTGRATPHDSTRAGSTEPTNITLGVGGGVNAVRASRPSSAPSRNDSPRSAVASVYGQISLEDEMLAAGRYQQ